MALTVMCDPEPDDALERLYVHERRPAERIDRRLDALAADPGSSEVRRRVLRSLGPNRGWGFVARGAEDDQLVLWQAVDENTVVVRHIGPDI